MHAVAAPAGALLCALARAGEVPLVIDQVAASDGARLTLEWPTRRSQLAVLEHLAGLRSWRVEQVGSVRVLLGDGDGARVEEAAPVDVDARRSVAVQVPGREPLALALQAVVMDDPPIAIVSGRVYGAGEFIVDPRPAMWSRPVPRPRRGRPARGRARGRVDRRPCAADARLSRRALSCAPPRR